MCGRFFRHEVTWADYHDALGLIPPEHVDPPEVTYNAAPMSVQPIIRHHEHTKKLEMAPCHWGLIPSWWTKPLSEKKFTSFNARSETVSEKAVFRGAFRHRRCLIPASGYYEWSGPTGRKTPFAVGIRNQRWFCFAGLWDSAIIDGSVIETFAVLTTEPNESLAGIHHRMPVILKPADYDQWLTPSTAGIERLFEPFPAEATYAWAVGPEVGNVRNNHPGLIEEV